MNFGQQTAHLVVQYIVLSRDWSSCVCTRPIYATACMVEACVCLGSCMPAVLCLCTLLGDW